MDKDNKKNKSKKSDKKLHISDVMVELPEFELNFCEKCFQMTNHLNGICQKCKGN